MSNDNKNPWVVQDAGGYKAIPPGMYLAEFRGVEDREFPGKDGPPETKWRWRFGVKTGEYAGCEPPALTGQRISPGSHAGRLISGIIGRELKAGDEVKALVDACVGQSYLVAV